MQSQPSIQKEQKLTGKHVFAIMCIFFGTIMAVNFSMATLASKSWTGLVVKNSYVASQNFNEELVDAKAQRASGVHSNLSYEDGVLSFTLLDKNYANLEAKNLTAEIGRPAFEQADQVVSFQKQSAAGYSAHIKLEPGYWAVKLTATSDGVPYRRDARIFVDANGIGIVQ